LRIIHSINIKYYYATLKIMCIKINKLKTIKGDKRFIITEKSFETKRGREKERMQRAFVEGKVIVQALQPLQDISDLFMVLMSCLNGTGPVELFEQEEAGHFVGEGEAGQRPDQICLLPHPLIQAEMSTNEKTDRGKPPIFPSLEGGGPFFGPVFLSLGIQGHGQGSRSSLGQQDFGLSGHNDLVTFRAVLFFHDLDFYGYIALQPLAVIVDGLMQIRFLGFSKEGNNKTHYCSCILRRRVQKSSQLRSCLIPGQEERII
jgi:hypothetical protein